VADDDVTALARHLYDDAGFHAADSWATETSIRRGHYEALAEAVVRSPWLAQRDARIRAEALRDAADDASRIHCGYPTNPHARSVNAIGRWLRARADHIEAGEQP
jgi:hypothetical protein